LVLFYRKLLHLFYAFKFNVPKSSIIQIADTTRGNRHPDLFHFCQEQLKNKRGLKILSFGCSTGEESFSLREYFPDASIFGCDINRKSLSIAQKNNTDDNIKFFLSNEDNLLKNGPFDLIFALSVLCKEPECRVVADIAKIFPFQLFNTITESLDTVLNNNGLLVIRNSNYMFEDTISFKNYECLFSSKNQFPVFDKKGHKKDLPEKRCEIFKKK
jgi:chemotaxis methyl-accepting protein methylase